MALLGLDFFESKESKKIKDDAYNRLYFPYGDIQKEKIIEILQALSNNITKEEIIYNYVVTKQELMKKDLSLFNESELKELIQTLNSSFISKDVSSIPYIVLANEDIHIDTNLNYSTVENLKRKINELIK